MNAADARAAVVSALDELADLRPADIVVTPSTVPGYVLWSAGRMTAHLPRLLEDAPPEIVARYAARVRSTLVGACPLCGAVMSISHDPERTPAAFALLPVVLTVPHAPGCPALFGEADRRWFDPEAFP